MKTQSIHFPGAAGNRLAARLESPLQPPSTYALLVHCFTCSKDLKALGRISNALCREGIGVLRFDFTGLGGSEGDFADTNFSSNLDDLVAAADFMRAELEAPAILIGHSLGGAAVLGAAHRIPEARAVVTIGAPSEPSHLLATLGAKSAEVEAAGEAQVNIAGRQFTIKRQLLEDLQEQRLVDRIANLGRPLLILHSPTDQTVGVEHARRIYEAAKHPKSFVSLAGADHLLLENPEDALFVGRLLAAWASRYVSLDAVVDPLPAGEVQVEVGPKGYTCLVRAGRHRLLADEPQTVGGDDAGPNPYAYLLAALGSCTAMTLRMYADRKEWPLEGVQVTLEHDRIHAKDCSDCDSKEGNVGVIQRVIELDGNLDDEQRQRLLEIADRCPVHRTLEAEVRVRTRLEGGS
ncbi:MAG: bifunctional alpha/beta hydrolase/OsmC family protein [Thermoanaerobaculia bacterium]|nr:bifunctional alpha/beta hydrolase/OsmC family protein [Thermoanaerobaculia bacterium]